MGCTRARWTWLPAVAAEFAGTAVLLFFGCLGCVPGSASILGGIAFGAALTVAIHTFGHISGGHFNPAVTLSAVLFDAISPLAAAAYVPAQLAGATAGFGLSKLVLPQYLPGDAFCNTVLDPELYLWKSFLLEFFSTFLLVLLCCGTWDERNANRSDSTALKFGIFLFGIILTTGHLTGASLNPARSFAPSLVNGNWDNHWVYWAAPLLGGSLASISYKVLLREKKTSVDDYDDGA